MEQTQTRDHATESEDTEDMVSRLRLLHMLASDAQSAERDKLINTQRDDGGWAQTDYLQSDAYATGTVLAALADTKLITIKDPVYQRGLQFLLHTQEEDGSWHVRKRTRTFQPFFESRFPHQRDQFISIAATSWSIYALVKALPETKTKRSSSYASSHPIVTDNKSVNEAPTSPEALAFFTEKIQPVLSDRCYRCHSADAEKLKANLHLDTRAGILAGGENGPAVVPENPEQSLLIKCLLEKEDLSLMPPKKPLDPAVIEDFKTWIVLGVPHTGLPASH